MKLFFALQLFDFFGVGGGKRSGFRWISTLGGGAFGICMPACRKGEHTEPLFFIFTDRGAVFSGDLYSRRRRF